MSMKRWDTGALVKDFGVLSDSKEYPLSVIVRNVEMEDPRFVEKPAPPLNDEFPIGTNGFYLGEGPLYGHEVTITGYGPNARSLNLSAKKPVGLAEPVFVKNALIRFNGSDKYSPGWKVAKEIGCSSLALSRLSSTAYVVPTDANGKDHIDQKHNIGLSIKFDARQLKVAGYTRFSERSGWEYSVRAVELLREYKARFPSVFAAMATDKKFSIPSLRTIFPDCAQNSESLRGKFQELKDWLKAKGVKSFEQVALEVEILPAEFVFQIEKDADAYLQQLRAAKVEEVPLNDVQAQFVLLAEQAKYRLSFEQQFSIGDRVIFALEVGAVPMGSGGTVVGVEKSSITAVQKQQSQTTMHHERTWIHVVFDQAFLGGFDLGGRCSQQRGQVVSSAALLNVTNIQPPMFRAVSASTNTTYSAAKSSGRGVSAHSPKPKKPSKTEDQYFKQDPAILAMGAASSGDGNIWEVRANKTQLLTVLKKPKKITAGEAPASTPSQAPPSKDLSNQLKALLNISPSSQDRSGSEHEKSPTGMQERAAGLVSAGIKDGHPEDGARPPSRSKKAALNGNKQTKSAAFVKPAFKTDRLSQMPTSVLQAAAQQQDPSKVLLGMIKGDEQHNDGKDLIANLAARINEPGNDKSQSFDNSSQDYVLNADLQWVPAVSKSSKSSRPVSSSSRGEGARGRGKSGSPRN